MGIISTIGKIAIPAILGVIAVITLTRFARGESIAPVGLTEFGGGLTSVGGGIQGVLTGLGAGTARLFDPLFTFVDFAGKVQSLFGGAPQTQTGGGAQMPTSNQSTGQGAPAVPSSGGITPPSSQILSFDVFQGADPAVQSEILKTRAKFPQFFGF